MSLIAASKITTADENIARVRAGIRKVAASKLAAEGPPGVLAAEAVRAPETAEGLFLVEVASNGDAVKAACSHCGTTSVDDDTIEWIIGNAWDRIAAEIRPA